MQKTATYKQIIKFLISLGVGLLLVYLWLRFIDVPEMFRILKKISLFWVLLSAFLYLFAYYLRGLRWKVILEPVEAVNAREVFHLFMAGMLVNYIIPIRAGEIAKAFFLKNLKGTHVSRSLPTIFIDKMMDLFPVVLLIILLPIIPIKLNSVIVFLLSSLLVIFLLFLAIIWLALRKTRSITLILQKFFFWLPKKSREKVFQFIALFVQGLTVIQKNKKEIHLIFALTILALIFDTLYIITMFKAFGFTLPFLTGLFGYGLVNLSYILPTPPAQIGSNEAVYIIVFTFAFGIEKNLVSAALGFAHLLTGTLIFLVGIYSLNRLNIGLQKAFAVE